MDDVPERRLRRDRLHRQAPGRAEHHAGRRRGRPALLGHLLGPQGQRAGTIIFMDLLVWHQYIHSDKTPNRGITPTLTLYMYTQYGL